MSGELQYSDQPADPRGYLPPPKIRPRLTNAQRRAIDNDEIAWEGWDAKGRPVLRDEHGRYAITKSGGPVDVTEPVTSD